jgi:flagellar biosynthesis/type III secretory pathway protein FliH
MRIDDINAMADVDIRENERLEKLAEEVYGKGVKEDYEEGYVDGYNKAKENYEITSSVRELHQYKVGLNDGYNKAKETLYTEEQVRESIEMAYMFGQAGHFVGEGESCIKEIIKSLKQPNEL